MNAVRFAVVLGGILIAAATPASAQLMDLLTAPKTLIDRAIEARSARDIARDNEIVLKVNAVMADLGTIKASTEIYEQRLLVTGIFTDEATYRKFEAGVRKVAGIKKLYWHVLYVPEAEREKALKDGKLLDWTEVLAMDTKAEARLVGTAGVADVNFRVAADPSGTVFLLGRARSDEEMRKAVARAKEGTGIRKVTNYVVVRP